ncbi:MAG TPA: hypothetical protein VEA69_14310, partial [Tepidisphaeraceae bacterium]|nr:hypothetical protein [Tepidisphaeraceae bacterium]
MRNIPRLIVTAMSAVLALSASAETVQLKATITQIVGSVQVRAASDQPWVKATVGMSLNENAEFRTGLRSAVQFVIPPEHTIAVDRLGVVKLMTAVREGSKVTTEIGMKYGRTRYD